MGELTFANTLLLSNAAVSLGGAFVSLEISSQFLIFLSLFSFILAWSFISLQIKEFRIMGLSINDSVYSSLFFFLTGLHFLHLLVGLFLCCLYFWGCSFPFKNLYFLSLRVSEVHLFYNLQLFYWHFLEFLWLFIFQVFYTLSSLVSLSLPVSYCLVVRETKREAECKSSLNKFSFPRLIVVPLSIHLLVEYPM